MKPGYTKPALTFPEQVALLRDRGLLVPDEEQAQQHLAHIGYYRLSGYWLPFKQADERLVGSFDDAVRLYEFDRRLRLLVIDAIERFEVHLRTSIAFTIGSAFGAFGHERSAHFRDDFGSNRGQSSHAEWLRHLRDETDRSHELFIKAYCNKYRDYPQLPIWMATEIMSLGTLSRLYGALKPDQQRLIATPYGLHISVLNNWLHVLSSARNVAAHHARLWNRDLSIQPKLPRQNDLFSDKRVPNKRRSYVLLFMLRYLTAHHHAAEDWARSAISLMHQWDNHPHWQQAMGLPLNWSELDLWQTESS